jgi:hypothetical protein
VGVVSLGRDRQRLLDLRLETKDADSVSRRICHDRGLFHVQRVMDVAVEHRDHVRRLVAVAAGILISENKKTETVFHGFRFNFDFFIF